MHNRLKKLQTDIFEHEENIKKNNKIMYEKNMYQYKRRNFVRAASIVFNAIDTKSNTPVINISPDHLVNEESEKKNYCKI